MTEPCDIGPELVEARKNRVPWKTLMDKYGLGRTRLYEIYRAELDRRRGPMAAALNHMEGALSPQAQGAIDTPQGRDSRGWMSRSSTQTKQCTRQVPS